MKNDILGNKSKTHTLYIKYSNKIKTNRIQKQMPSKYKKPTKMKIMHNNIHQYIFYILALDITFQY